MPTIGYGCLWPDGHFGRRIAENFATRVATLSGGALLVEVTPPTPDAESTRAVLDGRLQMASGHAIQDAVPEVGLSYLPYLYRSFAHFQEIWTLGSPVSDELLARVAAREVPVEVLGYSLIGKRAMILRERPITCLADFKGLRVRVDGSRTATATFAALAAEPAPIEYYQTLAALRAKTIDAAENSPFNLIAMGWREPCAYVSLTEHLLLLNVEIINAAFWHGLSAPHQALLRAEIRRAARDFAATARAAYATAIASLAQDGKIAVNRISPAARAELEAATGPMRARFVAGHQLDAAYQRVLDAGERGRGGISGAEPAS